MKWNGRGAVVAPATRVALNVGPRTGIICVAKCVLTLAINLLIGRIRLQNYALFMPPRIPSLTKLHLLMRFSMVPDDILLY